MDNYWKNNSKEFKEFIDLLIAGYRSNEKKVSISLKLLSELTTQEKDAGKQLAKLMFRTSKIWKTDTKAFTKIKGNYLNLHLLSILRVVFLVTSPVVT